VDWAARAAWAGVSTGRERELANGPGREESWAAEFAGPGGERLGWPECGKERRSWVGPGSSGCWVGHWAEMFWGLGSFSDPFLFYFFSFLNLILIQTQGK